MFLIWLMALLYKTLFRLRIVLWLLIIYHSGWFLVPLNLFGPGGTIPQAYLWHLNWVPARILYSTVWVSEGTGCMVPGTKLLGWQKTTLLQYLLRYRSQLTLSFVLWYKTGSNSNYSKTNIRTWLHQSHEIRCKTRIWIPCWSPPPRHQRACQPRQYMFLQLSHAKPASS